MFKTNRRLYVQTFNDNYLHCPETAITSLSLRHGKMAKPSNPLVHSNLAYQSYDSMNQMQV